MTPLSTILLTAMLAGCAWPGVDQRRQPFAPAAPQAAIVPGRTVSVYWDNPPYAFPAVSGLEASVDLQHWQTVTACTHQAHCSVTLSNRPNNEFYRAFNRWTP